MGDVQAQIMQMLEQQAAMGAGGQARYNNVAKYAAGVRAGVDVGGAAPSRRNCVPVRGKQMKPKPMIPTPSGKNVKGRFVLDAYGCKVKIPISAKASNAARANALTNPWVQFLKQKGIGKIPKKGTQAHSDLMAAYWSSQNPQQPPSQYDASLLAPVPPQHIPAHLIVPAGAGRRRAYAGRQRAYAF